MARIIESLGSERRIIKISTDDVLSIVQDYMKIVPRGCSYDDVRSYLDDTVIYLPEEI